jgi:hypothetical protein
MPDGNFSTKPKPFIFVLMPFDERFSDIYKFGIKGAAEDADAYAERVDEQIFVEGMLDRIFNQINKADVIVADMTAKNPNVFYEVGYAHALNKVVLLITQSAEDIPFDLKHRQHIVYGGKIEHLRTELADRIRWAVGEAERRSSHTSLERISVRLAGVELPGGLSVCPSVELKGSTPSTSLRLSLQVWNVSERGLLEISHLYLFSQPDAQAMPVEMPYWDYGAGQTLSAVTALSAIGPSEVEGFTADPVDAPDGLTRQFRIMPKFGPMPPRTMEGMDLFFQLKEPRCNSVYRLRFHTETGYFDFCFRLTV